MSVPTVGVGEKVTAAWGNSVAAAITGSGAGTIGGVVVVTIVSGAVGTATVTFATPFAAAPSVCTQIMSGLGAAIGATTLVTAVSATAFTVRLQLAAPTASGIFWNVHWQAVAV